MYYLICWFSLVVVFNTVSFMVPLQKGDFNSFWVGYLSIMTSIIVHLLFSIKVFSEKEKRKQLLNVPVTFLSFFELLVIFICGFACMLSPSMPSWVATVLCAVILAISLGIIVTAKAVGEFTELGDIKLNQRVSSYQELVIQANNLTMAAQTKEDKEITKKLYEALRYSDPTSHADVLEEENSIKNLLDEVYLIMNENEPKNRQQLLKEKSRDLLNLVQIRNEKILLSKKQYK